jgi:hypothetical protein
MANKKQGRSDDSQAKRRMRVMQIIFAIFSLILILSMLLSAVVTIQ